MKIQLRQLQLMIVQRLVKSLYLALIASYHQLHVQEYYYYMSITRDPIPVFGLQMPCASICTQESSRARGGHQKPFSTKALEDS